MSYIIGCRRQNKRGCRKVRRQFGNTMGKYRNFFSFFAAVIAVSLLVAGCGIHIGRHGNNIEPVTDATVDIIEETSPSEQETDPEGTPLILYGDMQYEANIFLSNFAEQYGFTSYEVTAHDVEFLMNFAHRYAKINASNNLSYDQLYEVMTLDYANTVLDRFFGDSVSALEMQSFPAPSYSYEGSYHGPYYSSGLVYYEAADGATTTDLVVVDSAHEFPDGTIDMLFTKYSLLDFYDSIGGLAVTDTYYSMTPAQAASDSNLEKIGTGWATVIPKTYNGRNTYQLIRYQEY